MNADLLAQVGAKGWGCRAGWLDDATVRALAAELRTGYAAGLFRPAQVGAGAGRTLAPQLRSDEVRWLDEAGGTQAQAEVLRRFDELRVAANRDLLLGLFELEAHFAFYPPGAFYGRHVDRLHDDDARVLSVVLYLNEDWQAADGGQLRIDTDEGPVEVLPEGGTLALFLSDRFSHEVLPARRERLSLTGWFRRRPLS